MTTPDKLMNKNFLLLWQGQLVSQVGSQAFLIAMLLWLKQVTESATLVGLVMVMVTVPAILLGPLGGAIADRYSRRRVIIACDLLSGVAVVLLAAIYAFDLPQAWTVAALCVVAFSLGTFGSVFSPAVIAAVPEIVPREKVSSANSVLQGSLQIATLLAQGLGGILFRVLGAPLLVLVNGLTYLFSGLTETFMDETPRSKPARQDEGDGGRTEEEAGFRRQIAEGFRHVWGRRGLRIVFLVVAAMRFFVVPFSVLLPFYVAGHLEAGVDWFGYLMAGFGFGVLLGYALAGPMKVKPKTRAALILAAMTAMGALLGTLGLVGTPWAALALIAAAGSMSGFVNVKLVTLLQVSTPSEIRGRVMGLLRTVGEGLTPAAMLLCGIVADLTGQRISLIYVGCGAAMLAICITASTSGSFRGFLAFEPDDSEERGDEARERGLVGQPMEPAHSAAGGGAA